MATARALAAREGWDVDANREFGGLDPVNSFAGSSPGRFTANANESRSVFVDDLDARLLFARVRTSVPTLLEQTGSEQRIGSDNNFFLTVVESGRAFASRHGARASKEAMGMAEVSFRMLEGDDSTTWR